MSSKSENDSYWEESSASIVRKFLKRKEREVGKSTRQRLEQVKLEALFERIKGKRQVIIMVHIILGAEELPPF